MSDKDKKTNMTLQEQLTMAVNERQKLGYTAKSVTDFL